MTLDDKSLRICPHCGGAHSLNSKFCPVTGKPLSPWWKRWQAWSVIIIVLVLLAGGGWFVKGNKYKLGILSRDSTVSQTPFLEDATSSPMQVTSLNVYASPTNTPVPTLFSTKTPKVSPTPTMLPTSSPTRTSTPIVTRMSESNSAVLIYIPAGDFLMGSDPQKDPYFWGAEAPEHTVYLDAYWIYRTEVTNAMYQACVKENACPRPGRIHSIIAENYYENPEYGDYPVIYVSYTHALSYCRWVDGRLPTEAEWEKAARGVDGRLFPWGDTGPTEGTVNLCDEQCARGDEREFLLNDGFPGPAPVGSFLEGESPYGLLDVAGNVWEWTFDWFQPTYYQESPDKSPRGPTSGTSRVIRGGGWNNPTSGVRTVARASLSPDKSLDTLGFRCVVDEP